MPLSAAEIDRCRFSAWYKTFRNVTIKSEVIPLDATFVEYLLTDGIVLPLTADGEHDPFYETGQGEDDKSVENHQESEEDDDEAEPPSFPELAAQVADAMKRLDGDVFPKLNWSSPKVTIPISIVYISR